MAKAKSGGGINSRVVMRPPMAGGVAPTKINPAAVARLGAMVGNHATDKGTIKTQQVPLSRGSAPAVPMGNAITKTKPTVLRGGSQGKH